MTVRGAIDALRSGEAHLGVGSFSSLPHDVLAMPLVEIGSCVVMPSAHRLARKRTVALSDLAGEALVVPPAGRPHRTALAQALETAGVTWRVAAEASGWDLMLHFAALGVGLTVVNDFCRIPRGLVARPLRGLPGVRYSLLSRRGARLGAGALALRQCIVDKTSRR